MKVSNLHKFQNSVYTNSCVLLFTFILLSFSSLLAKEPFNPASVRSADCKPGVYQCGYLPASKEIQDSIPLKRDFNSFEELPQKADLSSKMPPVGNQGQQSSCVAWATGYAIKSYLASSNGKISTYDPPFKGGKGKNVFSPAFIYNQQNGGKDAGLYYYKTLEFLQKSGVAPWSSMPYTDKDYKTQPNQSSKQEALQYKIKSFSRLNFKKPDDIKRVLADGNVVLVGIVIDDAFYKVENDVYERNGGQSYGGHAMTIVGYDDSKTAKSGKKGAFKLQNSWGEDWGEKGFGWISYGMLAKVGQETYALIDDPKKTNQPMVAPPVTTAVALTPPFEIKVSRGEFSNKITLTWTASKGAISYQIQRKETDGKFKDLAYSNVLTYTDTGVSPDSNYTYRLLSISDKETSIPSKEVDGFTTTKFVTSGKLGKVIGLGAKSSESNGSVKVTLTWSEIDGASGYLIAKTDSTKKWKNIGRVNTGSFTDPSPTKDQTNVYRICAALKGKKAGAWSDSYGVDVASEEIAPGQVSDLKASEGEFSDHIQLSWNSTPGATLYAVFRFNEDGNPTGDFQTKNTSYADKDSVIMEGKEFAYTVIAINNAGYSEPSEFAFGYLDPGLAERSAGAVLPPPANLSADVMAQDKKINLKWQSVKDSNEYYIYRKQILPGGKSKSVKSQFISHVAGNQTSFSESFPGAPGDLFMYSVRSKSEFGSESKDSNIASVFINKEPSQVRKRAFSLEEIPKTFLGNWSGLYWNPKLGPQKLNLEVGGTNQDFTATLKINDKMAKQFSGKWVPGSTGLKTNGFQLDLTKELEGSSLVHVDPVGDLTEEMDYSFSKD